ncbi:hypothetical protein [Oceanobacillus saliphilus]|nr:hypothetical protein [Oceanobacillus saliphilus]
MKEINLETDWKWMNFGYPSRDRWVGDVDAFDSVSTDWVVN